MKTTTTHVNKRAWGRTAPTLAALGIAMLPALGIQLAAAQPASAAGMTYQVTNYDNDGTQGVYVRDSSDINNVVRDGAHYVTYATNVGLLCGTFGSPVGPHANTAWDRVQVLSGPNAGRTGYVSEHWLNTPVSTNQHVAGEPDCNTPAPPPPPSGGQTGNSSLETWFGSPVNGHAPTIASSKPGVHKRSYGGDWAEDIPAAAGQSAQVYVAPQDNASAVTTKVESIRPACASQVISDGGYVVQLGVYNGSARIGFIAYAHLNPSVSVGQVINRWGGVLGTVGSYRANPSGCWDGAHVHVEGYNVHHYSCFNGTYPAGKVINKSNFLGFVGGARGTRANQACP